MQITAELGMSGKYVTFELSGDAAEDIAEAVRMEHDCNSPSCDIAMALAAGFPFSAAHLLLGATTTPLLDAVVKHYRAEVYAEGQHWPKDWDRWTDYFRANTWQCAKCGLYVHVDSETCDNCLARRPTREEPEK